MKAALLRTGGGVAVEDVPDPEPGAGEIVVEMRGCGLCGSDLEKIRGTYTAAPPVIGHEAVGVVSDLGDGVEGLRRGDRVFPHHHVPCGACAWCEAGSPTMCPHYRETNLVPGGFAERFRVPAWNVSRGGVLKLPPALDFERATFIEPLACAIRGVERVAGSAGTALVLGAGPIGLLALQLLRIRGVERIAASEPSHVRRGIASRLGADPVWDPRGEDPVARARAWTEGRGPDLVLVATGHPAAIPQALRAVRSGGTVGLLGVPEAGNRLDADPSELVTREVSLVPSNAATERETRKAMSMIARDRVDVASLVTHRFPIADFVTAVGTAERAECVKAIVVP